MEKNKKKSWLNAAFIVLTLTAIVFTLPFFTRTVKSDLTYEWEDVKLLAQGKDFYSRAQAEDLYGLNKSRLPTYMPGFYVVGVIPLLFQPLTYEQWETYIRLWIWLLYLAIGVGIFLFCRHEEQYLLGLMGAFLWYFNRFTIDTFWHCQKDFFTLLFLLAALASFNKPRLSGLLLGLSLVFKHYTVLVIPLFLWAHYQRGSLKSWTTYMLIPPLAVSLPFLIWDPASYIKNLVYPVTRTADSHISGNFFGMGHFLGQSGFFSRLGVISGLLFGYGVCYRLKLPLFSGILIIFLIFAMLNPVLYSHYFTWFIPFLSLSVLDFVSFKNSRL